MADNVEKPKKEETKDMKDQKLADNPATSRIGWLYGILAVMVVVLVFMAGAAFSWHRTVRDEVGFSRFGSPRALRERGFMMEGQNEFDNNSQSRVAGVVTVINGDSFTVAGNGSTTEVKTSSSTKYQGGNQVKANDSVLVFGNTSDKALDATLIAINPHRF